MRSAIAFAFLAVSTSAHAQNVYFGNLHAHTSYSDGRGVPDDAYASARQAGLDFFAITEHNHRDGDGKADARDGITLVSRPDRYAGTPTSLRESAVRHTEPGRFVALYGQEFSTISSGNHINVFDVPAVIATPNGEFDDLEAEMRATRDSTGALPLLQFNHPRSQSRADKDYGRDDYPDQRSWVAAMDPLVELIEVLNAPALKDGTGFRTHNHQAEYLRYLNLGFHLSPSVGHDNHHRNWGTSTDARVAVIAPALTKPAILQAMRERHTYATEDRNLRVVFRANGALGGDIVAAPAAGAELRLTVHLQDPDEPNALYRVDVFKDAPGGQAASSPVETIEIRGNTTNPVPIDGVQLLAAGEFVLLRITQFSSDEHGEDDRVWTAPVWFEATASPAGNRTARIRIVALLPNPTGDERINEQVTIRNDGSISASLAGWVLRDLAGQIWSLSALGSLGPGQQATLRRQGQPMSLNNGGDSVELVDPAGATVATLDYGAAAEGMVIEP